MKGRRVRDLGVGDREITGTIRQRARESESESERMKEEALNREGVSSTAILIDVIRIHSSDCVLPQALLVAAPAQSQKHHQQQEV